MNASPPSGSPAACVRGAGSRGPRPIALCAGTVAKSGARPSAQGAPGPRRPAFFTAAETRNGAARLRVTGAGGAIGHGRTLARQDARTCTRCGTHPPVAGGTVCEPCHVARRDREREQYATWRAAGLCGRCGTPAPSDAAYCDRCAGSAAKRSRKKAKNSRSRQRYVQRRVRRLCIDCAAPSQGASRCPPCARRSWARSGEHRGLPVLPPRVTVIEIATGEESWDMGPVGRCRGLPGLRQAFPGPGGADPGYVEHRPVSGAGARKLVTARYARFREFAPLRLARPTPAAIVQAAIFGKCVATFRVLPDDSLEATLYVCPATWTRHDPPASRCGPQSQGTAKPG